MSSTATSARRMTLRQSLALVWRTLRSMRTALVLLLLLGVAAVAGSLVPQVGTSNARILAMFRDHPLRADIYDKLGLFDVFGSWWFTLIYTLLLISLAACLFPRTRAMVRNIRSRPQPSRELDGMRHYPVRPVDVEPERALADARRVLRRRFFRVARSNGGGPPALPAEKGPALYSSRRKRWVTAEPDGLGSVLKVGGFALQRRSQFEEEFAKLVDELTGTSRDRVGAL